MIIDSQTGLGDSLNALVVDDEPSVLKVVKLFLSASGFKVETAQSAVEAMNRFSSGRWDVVLTDLMMPEMTGDQLAAALRKKDPTVPIVLVSGTPHQTEHPFPFDGVVAKPFIGAKLLTAIHKAMSSRIGSPKDLKQYPG